MGFTAICWATVAMYIARFLINYYMIKCSGRFPQPPNTNFFSKHTTTDLSPQLKLNLKSTAMSVWTWWAYDVFTIIASFLGEDVLAA